MYEVPSNNTPKPGPEGMHVIIFGLIGGMAIIGGLSLKNGLVPGKTPLRKFDVLARSTGLKMSRSLVGCSDRFAKSAASS